jgi:hypothetical protein
VVGGVVHHGGSLRWPIRPGEERQDGRGTLVERGAFVERCQRLENGNLSNDVLQVVGVKDTA